MLKRYLIGAVAIACTMLANPAVAQEDNQPRTTYAITFYKFENGGDARWDELMRTMLIPAREAVGLPVPQVHWMMGGEWDIITVVEMTEGMAGLDTHGSPTDAALQAELLRRAGSQEAMDAMNEEMGSLVDDSMRVYSHTHP